MVDCHDNNITGNYNLQNKKHSRLFFEFKTIEYHASIFSLFSISSRKLRRLMPQRHLS